jgi:uncharacterized membrane protein (UPF0136 family)
MNLGIIAAIAYGILAVGGGIMGYVKAKSKISLFAGVSCGILLIIAGILPLMGINWGLILASVIATFLVITFISRLIKTRKLMPSALMIGAGVVSVGIMIYQIVVSAQLEL